jgi:uncharacterized DUF497 family protein
VYIIAMEVDFDGAKRDKTLAERGLDFADAGKVFDGVHLSGQDTRQEYAEDRFITVGYLDDRLVVIVWTPRDDVRRIILDPVFGRGQVGCAAVRWQGAPTQWADAHQEKQRSQRAVAWLNRMRSVLTRWVKAGGERSLNRLAAFAAVGSGQLPNLGLSA